MKVKHNAGTKTDRDKYALIIINMLQKNIQLDELIFKKMDFNILIATFKEI